MNTRKTIPVALTLVVAAGALAPAVAAPKPKPINEKYTVEGAPIPLPLTSGNSCTDPAFEGISITTKSIKTVGAGALEVTLDKFEGDWDITVMDGKGKVLGTGAGTTTPTALTQQGPQEKLVVKTKKAMSLQIAVCNFLGGPTAQAEYTFTYK